LTVQIPAAGAYRIDPRQSKITFHTRHMFGAGKVTGTLNLVEGAIVIGDPVTSSTARASADVASFKTNSAKRDKDVTKPNLLDTAQFPTMDFESTSVRQVDGQWTIAGQLTARGQGSPLELTVVDSAVSGDTVKLTATGVVDRYAHGITGGKGMVARRLRIELDVTASR
jgi:polyisoprenoid-binding protein YceI